MILSPLASALDGICRRVCPPRSRPALIRHDRLSAMRGASFLGEEVGGRAGTANPMRILRCTRKGIAGLRLSYCGEKPLSVRLMLNSPRVTPDEIGRAHV